MRVVKEFDEVELYWLLNGKGTFPNTTEYKETKEVTSSPHIENSPPITEQKQIERIVVFYKDGSFKAYAP